MNYPKSLKDLIECYKKLPGVGEKSAERMALATLELDQDIVTLFSTTVGNIKNSIKRCKKCNNYCEDDYCDICKDESRNNELI